MAFLGSLLLLLLLSPKASSQETQRFLRLYLRDKGSAPARGAIPTDSPFLAQARAQLTDRAIARRGKVLPPDSLLFFEDLPLHLPYLTAIAATGVEIAQQSKWFNSVMVRGDSAALAAAAALPFIDSTGLLTTRHRVTPFPRRAADSAATTVDSPRFGAICLADRYGLSAMQNGLIGIDIAHRRGFAGEGVLIGVLDAGFNWRGHEALRGLPIVAERDFVYGDTSTADAPGEVAAQGHGTAVLSIIAGTLDGRLVGGAPHASFLLARTEDVRSERPVEEDNWVAGIEWMEGLGVDVTNTSLGYTEFDAGDSAHLYADLTGNTAFASRGLNRAVAMGVICAVAAGNEGAAGYRYVSVPAEADSAIAVAAVDSAGEVARFSSRWFGGSSRVKPEVAAMGVANWFADHAVDTLILRGQGTSFATPLVTAAIADLLAARPGLTPWEVRSILTSTASRAANPDTAVGYGIVSLERALAQLATTGPIVGMPVVIRRGDELLVYAWGAGIATGAGVRLELVDQSTGAGAATAEVERRGELLIWRLPTSTLPPALGGAKVVDVSVSVAGAEVRSWRIAVDEGERMQLVPAVDRFRSTLCQAAEYADATFSPPFPNPFTTETLLPFQLDEPGRVTAIVYDAQGREVVRLLEETELDAGYHALVLSGRGLPSGAYYVQLRHGEVVTSTNVILLH